MNLQALQHGNSDEWDKAFRWVWPAAFGAAQIELQPYLPAEIEDVALEAVEGLTEKLRDIESAEELKPLVAGIAHNLAVSRLRGHFAQKRGAGQVESLEARRGEDEDLPEAIAPDSPVAALEQKELAERFLTPKRGDDASATNMSFLMELHPGVGTARPRLGHHLRNGDEPSPLRLGRHGRVGRCGWMPCRPIRGWSGWVRAGATNMSLLTELPELPWP